MKKTIIMIFMSIILISSSFSHSGRTDKNGGHNNTKTGTYHYHNGGSTKTTTTTTTTKSAFVTTSSQKKITFIQGCLTYLGFYKGYILGYYDEDTKKAVIAFKKKYNLTANETLSDEFIQSLIHKIEDKI